VVRELLASDRGALDPTVAQVIQSRCASCATDTFEALYRLRALARPPGALWQRCDLLIVPTAPTHPRWRRSRPTRWGPTRMLGVYTNFVNLLGWCALALPDSVRSDGLPFGVTFIGPAGCRRRAGALGPRLAGAAAQPLGATGRAGLPARRWSPRPGRRPKPTLPLAVVGAHLSGLPLNGQLLERGATLRERPPPRRLPPLRAARHHAAQARPAARGRRRCRHRARGVGPCRRGTGLLPGAGAFAAGAGLDRRWPTARHVHGFLCEAHALAGRAGHQRLRRLARLCRSPERPRPLTTDC
jgi:allophanate hydrolase